MIPKTLLSTSPSELYQFTQQLHRDNKNSAEKMVKSDDLGDLAWLVGYNASPDNALPKDKPYTKPAPKRKSKKLAADAPPPMSAEERGLKPPFTYGELIEAALTDKGPLSLSDIYNWIRSKFSYYRDPASLGWQNGIRHRLSTTPRFVVTKRKGTSGKGGVWSIADESTLLRVKAEAADKHHWKKQKLTEYETNSKFRTRRRRNHEPMEPHFDVEPCDTESDEDDESLATLAAKLAGRPIDPDRSAATGLGKTTKDQPKSHQAPGPSKTNTLNTIDINQLLPLKDVNRGQDSKEKEAVASVDGGENAVKILKSLTDKMMDDGNIVMENNSSDDEAEDAGMEDEENPIPRSLIEKTSYSNLSSKTNCDTPLKNMDVSKKPAAPKSHEAIINDNVESGLEPTNKQDTTETTAGELIKVITLEEGTTKFQNEKNNEESKTQECQTQEGIIPNEEETDNLSGEDDDMVSCENVNLSQRNDDDVLTSVSSESTCTQLQDDVKIQDQNTNNNTKNTIPTDKGEDNTTKPEQKSSKLERDKANTEEKTITCKKSGNIVTYKLKDKNDINKEHTFKVVSIEKSTISSPSDKSTHVLSKWASEVEVKNQKIVEKFKENEKTNKSDQKRASYKGFVTTPGIWTTITGPGKKDKICMNKKLLQKPKEKPKRKRSSSLEEAPFLKPGPLEIRKKRSPCKFPKKQRSDIGVPRAVKSDGNLMQYAAICGDVPIIPKGIPVLQTNLVPYNQYIPLQAQENFIPLAKHVTARPSRSNNVQGDRTGKAQGVQKSQSATQTGAVNKSGQQRILNPRANFTNATPMLPTTELPNIQNMFTGGSLLNPNVMYPQVYNNTQPGHITQGDLLYQNTQMAQVSTPNSDLQMYDHYSQNLITSGGGDHAEIMSLVQKQNCNLFPQVYCKDVGRGSVTQKNSRSKIQNVTSQNNQVMPQNSKAVPQFCQTLPQNSQVMTQNSLAIPRNVQVLPQNSHIMSNLNVQAVPQNIQLETEVNSNRASWSQGNEIQVPQVLQNTQKGFLTVGPQLSQRGKAAMQPQVTNSTHSEITLGAEILQNIQKDQLTLGPQVFPNSQRGQLTLAPEVIQSSQKGQLMQGQSMPTMFDYEGCDIPLECSQGLYEGWYDPTMSYNNQPYNNISYMPASSLSGSGS